LRDMGVEPFLLSSTLVGVLAQRLVRRLCSHCKKAHEATQAECSRMQIPYSTSSTIYTPMGCAKCNHTGYVGRTGIYEVIVIDDALQTMIHDGSSEQELERSARKNTPGIREDGIVKILQGVTSIEEVMRVTRDF